jgi:hypothetical protein
VQLGSDVTDAVSGYLVGAPLPADADPGGMAGMLSSLSSLVGSGIDGLFAH